MTPCPIAFPSLHDIVGGGRYASAKILKEMVLAKVNAFYDMQTIGCVGVCPECGQEEELKRSISVHVEGGDFRLFFHGDDRICLYDKQNMVLSTVDGRWRLIDRTEAL